METVLIRLTVYFDDPFWVGVFERHTEGRLEVSRVVYGAEPRDYDVYRMLLEGYYSLRYSAAVDADRPSPVAANPKRMQREAAQQLAYMGIGTKAQQALKWQYEQNKLERKAQSKQAREAEEERKFDLRQDKRKQKHKGH